MTSRSVPLARVQSYVRRVGYRLIDALAVRGKATVPAILRQPCPDRPVRVVFLVCDAGKWVAQPLFDGLAADPSLLCSFALTLSDVGLRLPKVERAALHAANRTFFARRGSISQDLFPDGRLSSPEALEADVLFLQQPWGMQDLPRRIGRRIPCAYQSYELGVIDDPVQQIAVPDFHPWLWRLFVPTEHHAEVATHCPGGTPAERIRIAGAAGLSGYLHPGPARTAVASWPRAADPGRKRVVYAPHHSLAPNSLRLATFDWSAPAVLALARDNPEVDFLLRPHPNLWFSLRRDGFGAAAEGFLRDWDSLPNTGHLPDGEQVAAFQTSDALVTDSASFLAEYMMTGQPILRLTRADSRPLSAFGRWLEPGFHACPDGEALQRTFRSVILDGRDGLAAVRQHLSSALAAQAGTDAARRIRNEILAKMD